MTIWATDENGSVQVEMDGNEDQFWLQFNKSEVGVLVMTHEEARLLASEIIATLERVGQ